VQTKNDRETAVIVQEFRFVELKNRPESAKLETGEIALSIMIYAISHKAANELWEGK